MWTGSNTMIDTQATYKKMTADPLLPLSKACPQLHQAPKPCSDQKGQGASSRTREDKPGAVEEALGNPKFGKYFPCCVILLLKTI